MDHGKVVKEQLLHLVFGAVFLIVLGVFAVALDLASGYTARLGVSHFTSEMLAISAHVILVFDLVLFFIYLVVTSIELVKSMVKK